MDSLTGRAITRSDWETAKVFKAYEQFSEDVVSEKDANVLEMISYFISAEISKE